MSAIRSAVALLMLMAILPIASCTNDEIARRDDLNVLLERHHHYKQVKLMLEQDFTTKRELPQEDFYLFGMGYRTKYLYKDGTLSKVFQGDTVRSWQVSSEIIMPSEYTVSVRTAEGQDVLIREDEKGIWLEEVGQRILLSGGNVKLPDFEGNTYAPILRVLHQEMLVNIIPAGPVPNLFVYDKPWYRDAAMVSKCLEKTGNLHLIEDWILGLSEPYDRNNAGDKEPDNLGQALYMISLVSNASHPLVATILSEIEEIRQDGFIIGRTDGGLRPVYQTKWLKYGLKCLNLEDSFIIPELGDGYSSLFWMDYKPIMDRDKEVSKPSNNYPYLGWARAHYFGDKGGCIINNLDYPLTWESHASQADYRGMAQVSKEYMEDETCVPHTWHSSEMFLYLLDF